MRTAHSGMRRADRSPTLGASPTLGGTAKQARRGRQVPAWPCFIEGPRPSRTFQAFRDLLGRATLFSALFALAIALASSPAAAQPRDRAAADALFQAARAEFDRGEFASACEKFAESNRLDPAPGTLLNLSLCFEKIGKVASAWEGFRQVSEQLRDERLEFATKRSTALEDRLPWLTLRLPPNAPEGTRIFRDGIELRTAGLGVALPVDPGSHTLAIEAPGHLKASMNVQLEEGQRKEIVVELGPKKPEPEAAVPKPAPPTSGRIDVPPPDRTLAWISGGIGVAGIATSLVTGALAISSQRTMDDHCDGHLCDAQGLDAASSGRTYATVSTISGAVGFVGLGASAYLFLSTDQEQTPATRIDATALPGGGYVGMSRRF